MADVVLLGPQRQQPALSPVLERFGAGGPVAVVTCGWQELEGEEADELGGQLGRPMVNLMLHQRGDDVFHKDAEFFAAYRERQNELRQLQELYRLRLGHTLEAAREIMRRDGLPDLVEPEQAEAIEAIRILDRHHLGRLREIHERFEARWRPCERDAIARHREEIGNQLRDSSVLLIAGGHAAVLLYRLRLFHLAPLTETKPVMAWSAGSMALSDFIVLFHDNPPQGRGNPEILDSGLGLAPGLVPFPDARRRLNLDKGKRVALLARRFAPSQCAALDEGAELYYRDNHWTARPGTLRLSSSGKLVEFPS